MPTKRVTPGYRRNEIDERAEAVFLHRRSGGQINRALASKLAEQGYTDASGFPLSTQTLRDDYARYVECQQLFHRDTHQSFGTLQIMRLERNMQILDKYLEIFDVDLNPDIGENGVPLVSPGQIFQVTALAKEIRQSIDSISKLTGSNAPTEVIVTQRLESEVQNILAILRQGLSDEIFQEVAQCLAKGVGLARERAQVVGEEMTVPGYQLVEGSGGPEEEEE
ncbi:hypothetical protein U2F10_02845 [Leptothoe sp. EHU-05/26/07-4]